MRELTRRMKNILREVGDENVSLPDIKSIVIRTEPPYDKKKRSRHARQTLDVLIKHKLMSSKANGLFKRTRKGKKALEEAE